MVTLEVHVQELFLSEGFITLAARKWLFPCVCALVHNHVAFLGKRTEKGLFIMKIKRGTNTTLVVHFKCGTHLSATVVTLFAFKAFLILVSLLVLNKSIPLMKHSITITAFLSLFNK